MSYEMLASPIELTDAELDTVCGGNNHRGIAQAVGNAGGAAANVAAVNVQANVPVAVNDVTVAVLAEDVERN